MVKPVDINCGDLMIEADKESEREKIRGMRGECE